MNGLLDERTELFRQAASRGFSTSENAYKGLYTHAKPGLHGFVASLAQKHFAAGARLLDCAAGSGALTLRLRDLGFAMQATDYVAENFRLLDVPFKALNLNEGFANQFNQQFDGIIAAEIIEHLENPRHFLRECAELIAPGGKVILTSPNASSPVSKTLLLRSGHTAWFSDADYRSHGHITPISARLLSQSAAEAGFTIEVLTSFGDAYDHCRGSPRLRALAKLVSILDTTPAELHGDILVSVLRARP